jgi:hypothetical protein
MHFFLASMYDLMMKYAACFKTYLGTQAKLDKGRRLLGLGRRTSISPFLSKKTYPEPDVVRIGGDLEILEAERARKSVRSSVFGLICFMVMSDGPYKPVKERLVLEVENKSTKPVRQKGLVKV